MCYIDFCCTEIQDNKIGLIKEICTTSSKSILDLVKEAENDLLTENDQDRSAAIEFISMLSIRKDERIFSIKTTAHCSNSSCTRSTKQNKPNLENNF